MREEKQIRERLASVESDGRLRQPIATVFENAPLALIQLEMETESRVLRWALKMPSRRADRRGRAPCAP